MPEPHLRAADADRAAVAAALGQHMSAGRLTLEEYDERLTRAYAAKTYGELDQLTEDLPTTTRHRSPAPATAASRAPAPACGPVVAHGWHGDQTGSAWRSWLTTALIVITIWGATSLASWELLYFWPVWVIGPWGAVLLAQTLTGGRGKGMEGHRQLG